MPDPQPPSPEALADTLSACADALHRRLMRALRQPTPDAPLPGISHPVAQALFDSEVQLRQRANLLYLDAAVQAGGHLAPQRQALAELAAKAEQIIARVDRVKDLADLAGELIGAGAAIASGKPEHILSSLEKLKHHIEAL
ncbi:hypothetical protein GTP38_22355 [Duganella sp. FT94W]|uniref:Uncharacterized protein n=1 Tax=Duganella lactea TaxID=2692173 RepID=A0ABW9VBR7_9BURK|nr:hypothetical protein [Duganella lactea]MYM37071.1 hypothetical protein [Duganella lactea]